MLLRLQKYLAEAGVASRRKSEELILDGKISVNGKVIRELGTKVDDKKDIVEYNGKRVSKGQNYVYILFNKPEGCVTTVKDQYDRKTVLDYFKDIDERIYPVGRLDYDTSGLLIMTNDGELTYTLTHPKHNVEKVYIAKVDRIPSSSDISKFENGLIIDGYKTSKAKLSIINSSDKWANLKITIHEGRNRQVRKMCKAIGCNVLKLKRIAVGKIELGNLKKGEYRSLTKKEVDYLQSSR